MTDQASLLLRKQLKGAEQGGRRGRDTENTRRRALAVPNPRRFPSRSRPSPPLPPELTKKPVEGFSAGLVNDSLFEWQVTIMGPPDTY